MESGKKLWGEGRAEERLTKLHPMETPRRGGAPVKGSELNPRENNWEEGQGRKTQNKYGKKTSGSGVLGWTVEERDHLDHQRGEKHHLSRNIYQCLSVFLQQAEWPEPEHTVI